ncbi:MAG TPA: tRNA (adenosine(37)-N6)-threonylcarbamoyltransferase complex dimerization subunit type 1 TsaB [Candidatus Krumholzibacteria bacterium]|nr:tRNA (adenosine(37)-N6)-threonylcarbamoyltransferase complex dimerization subunit type 1 TsaB [Candidatus Krumholzibacteria bacterium]
MVTIAIDTSHPVGTTALARDGVVLGEARFDSPSSHLVELSKAIERLLASSNLTMRDVDRIAVVLGPGSFTGVRIAVSFAKGLAAAGAQVVAMDSLRLLALPFFDQGRARVCAMIDAKRGEVYGALFERASGSVEAVVAPSAGSAAKLLEAIATAPDVFAGTGALAHRDEILARFPRAEVAGEARANPSTTYFASIAHHLPALARDAVRALEPVYLRASGAERKRLRAHAPEPGASGDD